MRAVLDMRFDMMSFQLAALIGDDRRWKEDFSAVSIDAVWAQVEAGAGQSLPWRVRVDCHDPLRVPEVVALQGDPTLGARTRPTARRQPQMMPPGRPGSRSTIEAIHGSDRRHGPVGRFTGGHLLLPGSSSRLLEADRPPYKEHLPT